MKVITTPIRTPNGRNFVTAVNGGGLGGPDSGPGLVALHTDAASAGTWETFALILQPSGQTIGPGMTFALQTSKDTYVAAVNGGGIGGPNDATCPIHTDAVDPAEWEQFTLVVDDTANPPTVKIKTANGTYVTAVNGGGVGDAPGGSSSTPVRTIDTAIQAWELFSLPGQSQLIRGRLEFLGTDSMVSVSQIATFLELFSDFYKACARLPDGVVDMLASNRLNFEQTFYDSATMSVIASEAQAYREQRFNRPKVYAVPALPPRGQEGEAPDVFFETIDKHSRLVAQITAVSLSLLTLAVILSGGTLKVTPGGSFEAQLPPLGTGIVARQISNLDAYAMNGLPIDVIAMESKDERI